MSSVAVVPPPGTTGWSHGNFEACNDEELLHQMWQQAEDFGERRRIRARMYKLKEQRLREMLENDDEALGTLTYTDDGTGVTERTETTLTVGSDGTTSTSRRSSTIQITMNVDGEKASTESISTENVRLGGITLRGVDSISTGDSAADAIINERIRKASQDRTSRYEKIMDQYDHENGDPVVSITKSTFSIQTGGLAGQGYHAMKNKEVRDSASPTRQRRSSTDDDFSANEGRLTSDDEAVIIIKNESLTKALNNTKTSRKSSKEERNSSSKSTRLSRQSEIPIRNEQTRKVSARKTSKELDFSSTKRTANEKQSPTSPKRPTAETTTKTQVTRKTTTATTPSRLTQKKTETKTTTKSSTPTRKSKLTEIAAKMDSSIKSEMKNLGNYLNKDLDDDDEIINEEEEEIVDESGNVVKMTRQTRKKKDGTEFVSRNIASTTKVVSNESEIDEILMGNPDHEVIERNVTEELDEDGGKIKIITETRKREDGVEYTTKNVLKTSKIFDFDHPEDIAHDEEDELISSNQTEETDETGTTIQTVIETRRKSNGIEYTTKKVYKTCKVSTQITPSDDDEVVDTKEEEEKQDDGSIVRTLIETRRTKEGQEYTHRQIFKTRRMTLTGVELQQGIPMMQNNDEIIDKKEKEEIDSNGITVKVVTETRKRNDGSTYTFEYVLRSFKGTKEDVQKMPYGGPGGSNIPVNAEDEIISEEIKEDVQEDGSTVKTIIERRRAKDGTQYLRHRIMRIPKMPVPVLQIASLEDEILNEEKNEEVLDNGTQCRRLTERRRSSVSGLQYTLRRTSKVYQQVSHRPTSSEDEIMDENVTEEESDDGSVIKTIIKRFQRPDGSIYNTHHVLKTFKSPGPVKFIGIEDDELIDQSISEKETEDGYIVKTINETRCRADGVQYTVERTETSSKHCSQVHITLTDDAKDKIYVGSPVDVVISREEQEEDSEDGVNIKTVTELRRTGEGSEYKTKTVVRSTAVLVPDHETCFVVIKPDDGIEEGGLAPSMDDELIYTRKKEETDENGQTITVIIETRQSKTTGEKYNITKKVHTKDVVLTPEGEKEIPKELYKTTKMAVLKGVSAPTTEADDVDDTPYGSVSALKNRFASPLQDNEQEKDKSSTPDKTNTFNRKKFFEDAAKQSELTISSSPKSVTKFNKEMDISTENQSDSASIEVKLRFNQDEASVEDVTTQNVSYQKEDSTLETAVSVDKAEEHTYIAEEETNQTEQVKEEVYNDDLDVEHVNETEITEKADEIMRESVDTIKESDITVAEVEQELVPSLDDEVVYTRKTEETDTHGQIIIILIETRMSKLTGEKYNLTRQFLREEYEAEFGSLTQQENETKKVTPSKKQTPTTQKSKDKPRKLPENENKTKRDLSPRKKPEQNDKIKRTPINSRKVPSKDISPPTRTTPVHRGREPSASKDPVKRITRPSPSSSPARGSPHRGRSPLRSGTSTPRDGTPTGRQCCQRHREASAAAAAAEENVSPTRTSPTRTPKVPSRVTQPVRKLKSPDEKPKMNGEIRTRLKTEDKVSNARKKFEKPSETPRSSRVTQSPRKPQVTRSPEKKETTKPLTTKQTERKIPVKPAEKISSKTRPSDFLEQGGKTLMSSLDAKPVVTEPVTPLTDIIKQIPIETSEEEGPVIEDVSMEPDHPYLKVQRPSLVREPSELPEDITEMNDSTFEESTDNSDVFMDNHEEQVEETVIEDVTKNESKEEKPRNSKILEKRLSDKSMSNKDFDTNKKENDNKQLSDKKKTFDRRSSETKSLTGKQEEDKKTVEKKRPIDRRPSDDKLRKQKDEQKRAINKKPFDRKASDEKIVKKKDEKSLKKRLTESETVEFKNNTYERQENLKNEQMSLDSQTAQIGSVASETAVSKTDLIEITDDVTTDSETTVVESSSSEIYKKAEEMSTQLIEDVERSIASQIISEDTLINSEVETVHLDEIEASIIPDIQSNVTYSAKEDVNTEIKSSVKQETRSKSKAEQKTLTTKEVNSRKALSDRSSSSDKKDTPRRKPSYEMKDTVSSRKSMFEQPKQSSVPSPIRKPAVKLSNLRVNNKQEQKTQRKSELKEEKKQEKNIERKPVEEPIIVPKKAVILGDKDMDESNESVVGEIKEDYEPTDASGLPLFGLRALRKKTNEDSSTTSLATTKASETISSRMEEEVDFVLDTSEEKALITTESETKIISSEDLESRKISKSEESSLFSESQTNVKEEQLYTETNLIKERSKSPSSRAGSQARESKEGSPAPFSKEGSPSRFATGKAVDKGVDLKKVRRVERAASTKKLYEDLEVSKENLPSYIASIETIFEVSTLEQMMEKAVTYEERRLIRTQLRLAKRQEGTTTKTSATTATSTYKRFADSTTSRVTPSSSPSLTRKAEVKQETKTKESSKKSLSSSEKSVSSQNLESDTYEPAEYEPSDSSGQPMFGLRALRKTKDKDSSTTSLTTTKASETISSRLEEEVSVINESKCYSSSQESTYNTQVTELEEDESVNTTAEAEKSNKSSHKTDYDTTISEDDRLSNINEKRKETYDSEIIEKDTNISVTDFKKIESNKSSKTLSTTNKTISESSTSDVYNEPLRHQKGNRRVQPRQEEQSDVEKIVSPYGCGPTDENGLPLFGLRALKRRTPTSTDLPLGPSETSSCEKVPEDEPTDASGRPLFGIRALKKSQEELLESQEQNETSTTVTSSSRASYNTSYTRRDEVYEGRKEREEEEEEKESSDDSDSSSESSDEATEPEASNEAPREKPKANLRDLEVTDLHEKKNTWDLESDLSTRSQDVKNIINKHETISVSENSEKKLTGILKKTSTSSISGSVESSVYAEKSTNGTTSEMRSSEDRELVRKTSYTEIKFSQPSSQENGSSSRLVENSNSATVESSSNEMRVESSSGGRSFLDDRSKVSGVTDILSRMSATEAVDSDKKITSDDQARSLLNRFLGAQVLMTGVESMMAANQGEQKTSSSTVTSASKTMQVRSEIDNAGRAVITHEASGQASQLATKDGKVTKDTSKSFSTGPVTTTVTCKAPSEPVLVCGVNISEVTEDAKLNQLLDSCDEYEDRRKVRMRLKALMAEKKALREELSGHDLGSKGQSTGAQESRTREAQALSTTSNTKQSNLRSTEGELEPIIYDQLKNTLEEAKSRAEDTASGLKGTNKSSLSGSSHYLSYDTNSSKVEEEHLFDSGTESGDDNRNQDEFESFMGGIRSCFSESNINSKNIRDKGGNCNFNEFSTELVVEVNSVLDKVKSSLSNASDQSQIPKEIQGSQGKELLSLIDRLQQSIGGVIKERKVDEQEAFWTEPQNIMIPIHEKDNKVNGIAYIDAEEEVEEDEEEESEDEEEEEEEEESEEEDEEEVEGELTPETEFEFTQQKINKKISNNLVRENSSGIIRSSSYASSGADSPAVVTGGLKFSVNLNEAKGITLKLDEMESTSAGSKGMNSNKHSIQTNINHNSLDNKHKKIYRDNDGEFVDAEEYVSSYYGTNESKSSHQDSSQHKGTKEVPWKIRAAKKRIESHQHPSIKDENTNHSSGTSEVQGRTRVFGSNISQRQKSFSNLFNKESNTAPALIATSKSLGNVNKLADRWNTSINNAKSSSNVAPQFYKPVYSKSTEQVKAQFNKVLTSFSTGSITPTSPRPTLSGVEDDSDSSDDSDESDDEGEVYSVKPLTGKTGTMAELPGIFHKHQEPHGVKPQSVFQKLEGSQVHKKSEMFSNLAKHPAQPQVSQKPFVFQKQVQPNRTFQTQAHLQIENYHSPVTPPRENSNHSHSQPLKRPTTLAIQPFVIDKPKQPVSVIQPLAHANNEPPPPPLPQRGEHPQPPPLPERSDSSHAIFKQHSNNNVAAFQSRLQPLPKSKSTPNANIAPEVQELKKSAQNRHVGNQSNEYEIHNNVAKAPVFDKSIRTNKVSAMQSRIERRMFGDDKDSPRQNFLSRTRSSGSVLEKARNLDTHTAEQQSLEEYEAQMQGKPRYNRAVSDDPSSMLFTPEQLVKIAVHKAAISKQLDAGEEQRKVVDPNQHNNSNQNMSNVYNLQQQNGLCQQHKQQQIQEHAQLASQRQLEEQQEQEIQRQERLKQIHEQQERQRLLQEQQQRQLQEQEKQRVLQEKERQIQLQEQQKQRQLKEQQERERQIQEQERQKRLNEQQERERQRQLLEHQERQRQLQEQEKQRKLLEEERQRQLQEQERKRKLQEQQEQQRLWEEQQEMGRQRQIKEQEEQERQQKLIEVKEKEIQRRIQEQQEIERQCQVKEEQERERQRQIQEQQEKQRLWQEQQREILVQQEKERQRLIQEQQEKQRLWQEQQEIQKQMKEDEEKENLRQLEEQQETQRQWEERQRELQEQEKMREQKEAISETNNFVDPAQILIEKQAQIIAEQKKQLETLAEQQRLEREKVFAEQQKQLQVLAEQQKQLLLLQQQKNESSQAVTAPIYSPQSIIANEQQQPILNNQEEHNQYQVHTTLETRVFANGQQVKQPPYSPPVQSVQGQHKGILKQNSLPNMLPEQQMNLQKSEYNVAGAQAAQQTNMSSHFSREQTKQVSNSFLPQNVSQQIVTDSQTPPGSPIAFQQPVQVKVRGQMQTSTIKSRSVQRHGDNREVSASPPRGMQRNLSQERGRSISRNIFGRQGSVEGAANVLTAALTRHRSQDIAESVRRRSVSATRRGSGSVGHESDDYIVDNDTEVNDDEVFIDPMVDNGTQQNPVKHGAHDGSGSDALKKAIAEMDGNKISSISNLPADIDQPATLQQIKGEIRPFKRGGNATPPEPVRFKIGGTPTPPEPARSAFKRTVSETPTPPESARSIFKAGFSTPPEPARTTFKPKFSTPPEPARPNFKASETKSSSVSNLIERVNAQSTVSQSQISGTPFGKKNRDNLRAKSSSISSIQDKTAPKAHAPVLKGLTTSLSNIASTVDSVKTMTTFGNVRTQQVVPPLPTTENRKEKLRQQALQQQEEQRKAQPKTRVERWNSNPDNFVVPPLPTSTHRFGPGGQMMHRAMSTSSLNPGTTTVTYEQSKMTPGQGILTSVSSTFPQSSQDENNPQSPGKVASVWESAVSKSETSTMNSKSPWQEGTSTTSSGHYVKTATKFLQDQNQVECEKVSPKSPSKSANKLLLGKQRSKSNDGNSSNASNRTNLWENQIKQSLSKTDIKSGGFVTGKLNVNNINRLDQPETVVSIKTVKRENIKGQTKNQAKNWEKIISEDNKAVEKSETVKKINKNHIQKWENRDQEEINFRPNVMQEKDEKVKMRVKERQQIWERRNSGEILDLEEKEKEERVKRLSKEQILQWDGSKGNENEIQDTQERHIRVNKLQTDHWENSLTNEAQTVENPVVWKDPNASPGQVRKDILSKFDITSPTNSTGESPPKVIQRSSSAHMKRNIKTFEQGLQEMSNAQENGRENNGIQRSSSNFVKQSIAAFAEPTELEQPERKPVPLRHSGSSSSNFVKQSIAAFAEPTELEQPERKPVPLRHSGSSGLIKNKMAMFDSQGNLEPVEPENVVEKRKSIHISDSHSENFSSIMERTEIRQSGIGVQSISLKIPVEALQGNMNRPQSLTFYPPDTNDELSSSDKLLPRGIQPSPSKRQNSQVASPKRKYIPNQFEASMTPDQAEKKQSEVASYFQQSNPEMMRMMNQAKNSYNDNSPDSSRCSSSLSRITKGSISGEDNVNLELMDEWENLLTGTDIHQSIDDVFSETLLRDLDLTEDESEHLCRKHSELRELSLFRDLSISRESKLEKSQTNTYHNEQHTNLVVVGQSSESQIIGSKAVVNIDRLTSEGQRDYGEQSGVAEPDYGDVDVTSATNKIGMLGTSNHGNVIDKVSYSDTNLTDQIDDNKTFDTHEVLKLDNNDYSMSSDKQKSKESSFSFSIPSNKSNIFQEGQQNNFVSTVSFTLRVCPEYTSSEDSDTEIGESDSEAGLADEEDNAYIDIFTDMFYDGAKSKSLTHSNFNIPKIIITDYDAFHDDAKSKALTYSNLDIPKIIITDCDAEMIDFSKQNALPSKEDMNLNGNLLSVNKISNVIIDNNQTSLVEKYFSGFKDQSKSSISNSESSKEKSNGESSNPVLEKENLHFKQKDLYQLKEVAKEKDSYFLHINKHISKGNVDDTNIPSADFHITNSLSQFFEVDLIVPSNQHDSYDSQNEILNTCKKRDTENHYIMSYPEVCHLGNDNIISSFTENQPSTDLISLPNAITHKLGNFYHSDDQEVSNNLFESNQDIEDLMSEKQTIMGDTHKLTEILNIPINTLSHFNETEKDSELNIFLSKNISHHNDSVNKDFDGNFSKDFLKKENSLNGEEIVEPKPFPFSEYLKKNHELKSIENDDIDIKDVNHDVELNFRSLDGKDWTVGYTLQLESQPKLYNLSDTSNTTDDDCTKPLLLSVKNISSSYTKQSEQCSDVAIQELSDKVNDSEQYFNTNLKDFEQKNINEVNKLLDDNFIDSANSAQHNVCSNEVFDENTSMLFNGAGNSPKFIDSEEKGAYVNLKKELKDMRFLRVSLEENNSWEINEALNTEMGNLKNEDRSKNNVPGSNRDSENLTKDIESVILSEYNQGIGTHPLPDDVYLVAMITFSVYALLLLL